MPLSHVSKVFAIKEAKVAKLTADTSGGFTYAASTALTGSQKLTIAGTINTKYLRGDNMLLDSDAVWDSLTATVDYAKLSLDAMATFYSTLVVDTGTTPNQLATLGMKNTDTLNYFKMEGRSAGADSITGDVLFSLWKCKLASFPATGLAEEDYQRASLTLTLLPRLSDNAWLSIVLRETSASLT
jgi:hypothetical protein